MRLMGMKGWLDWSAWYFKFSVFMLISVALMTVLFHVRVAGDRAVIIYTDASVTFVFLLLFSLSVMTLCFAVSTFCSKGMCCMHCPAGRSVQNSTAYSIDALFGNAC